MNASKELGTLALALEEGIPSHTLAALGTAYFSMLVFTAHTSRKPGVSEAQTIRDIWSSTKELLDKQFERHIKDLTEEMLDAQG